MKEQSVGIVMRLRYLTVAWQMTTGVYGESETRPAVLLSSRLRLGIVSG